MKNVSGENNSHGMALGWDKFRSYSHEMALIVVKFENSKLKVIVDQGES